MLFVNLADWESGDDHCGQVRGRADSSVGGDAEGAERRQGPKAGNLQERLGQRGGRAGERRRGVFSVLVFLFSLQTLFE